MCVMATAIVRIDTFLAAKVFAAGLFVVATSILMSLAISGCGCNKHARLQRNGKANGLGLIRRCEHALI
jgi:hypothetical protein